MLSKFRYESNHQVSVELKKIMLEEGVTQKQIAEKLGITPQSFQKLINKKNLGMADVQKILDTMNGDMIIIFVDKNKED